MRGLAAAVAHGCSSHVRWQLYLIRWDEGRLPEVADYIVSSPLERTLDRAFACHAYAHVAASREAQRLLTGLAARGFADVHNDGF